MCPWKPMVNKYTMMASSAVSDKVKRSTMTNEALRRLLFFFLIGQVALGSHWHHTLDYDLLHDKYNSHLTISGLNLLSCC